MSEIGFRSLLHSLPCGLFAPETSNLHLNLISSIGFGLPSTNNILSISFVKAAKPAFLESDFYRC